MVCEHEYMNAIRAIVEFATPLSQSVINAQGQSQISQSQTQSQSDKW